MIRPRFGFLPLLALLALTTVAEAVDKEKLRQAVSLPLFTIVFGYGVNRQGDFYNLRKLKPQPEKIAVIEKELRGDETDAERYRRLAPLYHQAGQSAKGKEARRKVVLLLREQYKHHPDDSAVRLRLADALEYLDDWEEAETLLRRAVKELPNDWHAWLALSEVLDHRCERAILGQQSYNSVDPEAILQSIRAAQPTPERIAAAQQYRREAVGCLDRAVKLAPCEAEVYRRRGASHFLYGFLDCGLRLYKGEKADTFECFLGRGAIADLRRAVDLSPDEYMGLGMVAMMEPMRESYQAHLRNPSAKPLENLWDELSESTRKSVRADLARLEKGLLNPDKLKAAEAAEVLGALQLLLFQDTAVAEKHARRSIELDPTRAAAWNILVACLLEAKSYRKMAAVCRQRLAYEDSSRNRLFLAKAYEDLDRLDKAEQVIRAGLKREPEDFLLNLALADLFLLNGTDDKLNQAAEIVRKLESRFSPETVNEDCWANYVFICAIGHGLSGDVKEAREFLEALRKRKPQYPHLQDALKALDE